MTWLKSILKDPVVLLQTFAGLAQFVMYWIIWDSAGWKLTLLVFMLHWASNIGSRFADKIKAVENSLDELARRMEE